MGLSLQESRPVNIDNTNTNPKDMIKEKSGGCWAYALLLLANQGLTTLAFCGVGVNLVLSLTRVLRQDNACAANNVSKWIGTVYLCSLIGAVLSVSYWGRYLTCAIFQVIFVVGLVLISLSSWIFLVKPDGCGDVEESDKEKFQRWVRVTIVPSVDFENAANKLLEIRLEPGQEMELCETVLKCCIEEKTYRHFYGLLGQRICMHNRNYQESFEKCFVDQYSMIHRLETNKLRNMAKFFAHLLGTDALSWHALASIRLTEGESTSSSRIFIKILFQELSNIFGEYESISVSPNTLHSSPSPPDCQDSFNMVAINQYFYYATQIPGMSEKISMIGKIFCGVAYVGGILYEVSRPCSLKDWCSLKDMTVRKVITNLVYTVCGLGIVGCFLAFTVGEIKKL